MLSVMVSYQSSRDPKTGGLGGVTLPGDLYVCLGGGYGDGMGGGGGVGFESV